MSPRRQSLLHLCVMRAGRAFAADAVAAGRDPELPPTRRETMGAIWRSTQDASKVAALIVLWSIALADLEREELGLEEFAAWSAESRATVYRRVKEFRRLWPEYHTPNELARIVLQEVEARGVRAEATVSIPVAA